MANAKCSFCGKTQEDFRGSYFAKNDGSMNYYCSSKCVKNQTKLKRDKRKIRWAEAFHITREKRKVKKIEQAERLEKQKKEKAVRKEAKKTHKTTKKSEKPKK